MEIVREEELTELIEEKKFKELKRHLEELNEVDIAYFIRELSKNEAVIVFRMLSKEIAADVFSHLEKDVQEWVVDSITDREISNIIEDLFVDDAVDFLEELPAGVVARVMQCATPETRKLINQFLKYPENSVGSIMTAEFVSLKRTLSVKDAFVYLRKHAIDKETIYTCYVTDPNRILEGVVSVKTLLLSDDDELIGEIMDTDVISIQTTQDREEATQLISKYDLFTLPVVDHESRLVGIVTVDDAVEVIEQEATEDFEIMAAMSPSERPYLRTGVFSMAKNRIFWLMLLMLSSMITGSILAKFDHAFTALPLLVTFIPMMTGTGGNAGSQSSTMVIRGMALSEIDLGDFLKVLWKELRVSLMVGAALSLVNFIRLIILYPGQEMIALTVVLSLMATIIIAKTIGALLPMFAKLIKADPAIMAAPLISTLVDACSLTIYFVIAVNLLNI